MIDINLSQGSPIISDDLSLVLQQIDLLFDTNKREVLGEPYFGTSYSDFLYNLQASNEDIKSQISSDLNSLDLLGFSQSVDVTLLEGSQNDIILVQIHLQRDEEYYNKTFKITS